MKGRRREKEREKGREEEEEEEKKGMEFVKFCMEKYGFLYTSKDAMMF